MLQWLEDQSHAHLHSMVRPCWEGLPLRMTRYRILRAYAVTRRQEFTSYHICFLPYSSLGALRGTVGMFGRI